MVPELLHVRNFLSHRETEIDLRGVRVASMVGDNGAGKSALLDAITWAIWERSRLGSKRDADLVYHGADMISVELVFRMAYVGGEERRYRILRRRTWRGRRTSPLLDFQVEDGGEWRSLTADSYKQTQARIIEHLGLDYETFVRSAYLRQGEADAFTVQSPAERKRTLGAILGLGQWQVYDERAKERLHAAEVALAERDRTLAELEEELNRRAEYEARLEAAQARVEAAETRLQKLQAERAEVIRVQEQVTALERQAASLAQRRREEESRLAQLRASEAEHHRRLAHYRHLVERAEIIEMRYRAYRDALEEERAWGEKLSRVAQLRQELTAWERNVAQERERLSQHVRQLERQVAREEQRILQARAALEQQVADLRGEMESLRAQRPSPSLQAEMEEAQRELSHLAALEETVAVSRRRLQEVEVEHSRLVEWNRQLRQQVAEAREKLATLVQVEAMCPLCRQPLTPDHRHQLLAQLQDEVQAMEAQHKANEAQIRALQGERRTLRRQIEEVERRLRGRPHLEQKVARCQERVVQWETARERLEALEVEVGTLEAKLAAEDYAAEARARLTDLHRAQAEIETQLREEQYAAEARAALTQVRARLAQVGYDASAHAHLRACLRQLEGAEAEFRELEKARLGLQSEEHALARLAEEIAAQQARLEAALAEEATCRASLDALRPRAARQQELEVLLKQAHREERDARLHVGAARQQLAALKTVAQRRERVRAERESLARRVGVLKTLRRAFGVNGVPAMIIEHALPALEREATRILRQLTNGRMHLRFETQRPTQRGGVRETLDILISDEKGTRPYENFSGGEQFRINFAIRVALSRLLAQRAGVRLRTLFVDEGFGALDTDGRRRLVEAIKAVQEDFDMILVITHIEEMRDAFPTHIRVAKTPGGSVVEVV